MRGEIKIPIAQLSRLYAEFAAGCRQRPFQPEPCAISSDWVPSKQAFFRVFSKGQHDFANMVTTPRRAMNEAI